MKTLLMLGFLSFVGFSLTETSLYPRGCICIDGICDSECEVGTHEYTADCGNLEPEPTCDNPTPETDTTEWCDYSACYCDPPTVRNKVTEKCVSLSECPK